MESPKVSIEGHEKWIEIRATENSKGNKYFFLHEVRCNGIVAVLPFRITEGSKTEVLAIKEITPCWEMEPVFCSLTGGIDNGSTAPSAAIKEIEEELGIIAPVESLISLGTCYGTKSTDTIYELFAIDITRLHPTKEPEHGIQSEFFPFITRYFAFIKDPIFHTMASRLSDTLFRESQG
jgi:8-oxo-dGTP pyrophosphatase MutT (NUDIX family)